LAGVIANLPPVYSGKIFHDTLIVFCFLCRLLIRAKNDEHHCRSSGRHHWHPNNSKATLYEREKRDKQILKEKNMKARMKTLLHKSNANIVCLALLSGLAAATALLAGGATAIDDSEQASAAHEHAAPAKLVQLVRQATRQFIDVNAATAAGYQPSLGCVSGPDHGAMGVHYINGALVGDGEIDASRPEALIYEPWESGLRLVGVEFIVDAATWLAHHDSPPVLEGQVFQLVNSPNRYASPAFFELHVWAWRENPNGAFVDWNNRVTCEGQ
jgi:hypothetical protein